MFVGLLIGWGYLVPALHVARRRDSGRRPSLDDFVGDVFVHKVRFVGAGTIGVAAIWTLLQILGPIIGGIRSALAATRERKAGRGDALPLTERDIPIGIVAATILAVDDPDRAAALRLREHRPSPPIPARRSPAASSTCWSPGVVIAAVCGYMAGLIGASNSPVSGIGILSVARHRADPRAAVPGRRAATRPRRWSPSPCSSPRSCSASRPSPTTTSRI